MDYCRKKIGTVLEYKVPLEITKEKYQYDKLSTDWFFNNGLLWQVQQL